MSDAPRITTLRTEITRWNMILADDERPPHARALAGRRIAELQLDLEQLTGEVPSISMHDVEQYEAATREATRRVIAGQVPQMGHMANVSGNFQRRELPQTSELVEDPVSAALRDRPLRRAELAPKPLPLGYGAPMSGGPIPTASPTGDLCSPRGPVPTTRRVNLSGAE
jgi:hypothetical protein